MELPDRCRFFLTERGVELGSSANARWLRQEP